MAISSFKGASAASGVGGSNDFTLSVGVTGNTTYVLDRVYTSGRYTLVFANSDTTYDIYAIAEDGTYAGYTNGAVLEISANFTEIVVLGAASSETIIFSYEGTLTAPSGAGDVATAGAFVSGVVTSSLPGINDTTVVNGGNFAANVVVSFIDQSDAETLAKNVVRSSSTQLVVTRPDAFSPDNSPYTVKVVNPGIPVPSGSNAYLLVDSVTAGTNPAWQTTGDLFYNIGAATSITLLATDSEGTDIDYSVVSGTLPAGLTLVEETGVISGTFSGSATEGDTNSVTFKAIDTGGNFLNKAFNFVANYEPVWSTAAGALDPEPVMDQHYSFQLVASTGPAGGTLVYTLQAGSLSTGLTLSNSGEISGITTDAAGTVATFTIRVTDTAGLSTDREFTSTTVVPISAIGGTVTTISGYKVHTFTSSGTFEVTAGAGLVEYIVIAGGGGTARAGNQQSAWGAGGGGAGGYRSSVVGELSGAGASAESAKEVEVGSYTVTVGAGGVGGSNSNGSNSVFSNITSLGGSRSSNYRTGTGGSGNGGMLNATTGGSGTAGQGLNGGNAGPGVAGSGAQYKGSGGGGGGAAGSGGNGVQNGAGGTRGSGRASSVTGSSVTRATGGEGGANNVNNSGVNGGANTGDGADGGGATLYGTASSTQNGGSGIVIVRYAV